MTRFHTLSIATALAIGAGAAHAIPLNCTEDKTTNGYFCFAEKELREVNGIRTAPFYMGGPNGVERTPYRIAANCATGVLHLKDRQGVSFGGSGPGEGTVHSRQLRQDFCAAAMPTKKN